MLRGFHAFLALDLGLELALGFALFHQLLEVLVDLLELLLALFLGLAHSAAFALHLVRDLGLPLELDFPFDLINSEVSRLFG